MRYIHIMQNDKCINSYIEFIEKNFNMKEHYFYIIDGVSEREISIIERENIKKFFCQKKNKILKLFKNLIFIKKKLENEKIEKIYFHGLFGKDKVLFLFIFRKYLKKSNWIVWGGDLYCYEKRKKSLQHRIWYYVEEYVKRNIGCVSTLVPDDYEIAKKYYNVKGKYRLAIYPGNDNYDKIDKLKPKIKDEIYIQIGNSADPSNNHFEIIDLLSKFKDEKIKIYAVLSYGDKIYGQEVNEYGRKVFGNKFIGIFNFMSRDKYWEYLKDIDILVFNHQRQQGLGNIMMLSFFEKKIYIRDDISSWNYLVRDIELKLNSVSKIKDESFKEFIQNNAYGNKEKLLKTRYSNEYRKKLWENIFNTN